VTAPDDAQRGGWTRVGRALGFVVLVWVVAATFVGFDVLGLRVMGFLLSHPELAPSLVLTKATTESKTCVVESGADSKGPSAEVLVGAWVLGLASGRDALARQYESVDRQTLAAHIAEVAPIAEGLGVPPSSIFVPRHVANANTEFIVFVESDPSGTARRLAVRHGTQPCHLYKMGSFWGYASLVRPSLPGTRTIFAAEIGHHAKGASVPREVSQPLLDTAPSDASFQEIAEDSIARTQQVTAYLQRPR
jgi:hypothetical protein